MMAATAKEPRELVFIEESHQYFLGDRELLSVTTVLNIMGFTDFSKVPPDTLEHARHRGDLVHQATHMNDLGASEGDLRKFFAGNDLGPDEGLPYVRSWQTLLKESDIAISKIEEEWRRKDLRRSVRVRWHV